MQFIAGLDVGTTSVRCNIYELSTLNLKGHAQEQIHLIYPKPGYSEIKPNELFRTITSVIRRALEDANISAKDLNSMGISCQRSSFVTWERETGRYFHNFITWQDLRANELVEKWNGSFYLKAFKAVAAGAYFLTRNAKFLCGRAMKFLNPSVIVRLAWAVRNIPELEEAMNSGTALCGTLDSWLLYKLRQGHDPNKYVEHISDYSNCTATAYFDPFTLKYSGPLLKIVKINEAMLPAAVKNSHDFGYIDRSLFGCEIRIASSIADQSASMWGQGCFQPGDIKVTLGTGAFLNLNSGTKCHGSSHGLYPIVAWATDEPIYSVEGASNDMGSTIDWAVRSGIIESITTCSSVAFSVPDTNGVCFVPALAGLGPPINDQKAACGFIGINPSTENPHLVRAVLESLVFRVALLIQSIREETDFKLSIIKVDGGVSKNDFMCQTLASLTGLIVERANSPDMTILGAVYVAGINQKLWTQEDILKKVTSEKTFIPDYETKESLNKAFDLWKKATRHFSNWY